MVQMANHHSLKGEVRKWTNESSDAFNLGRDNNGSNNNRQSFGKG